MSSTSPAPYRPFGELSDLRGRLDQLFDDLAGGGQRRRLAVDVIEEDDRYLMRADVPGMKPEDVKIEIDDGTLTVSGSHEESSEKRKDNYVRRERRYGSFSRSMAVPRGVKPDDVSATMSEGVLEVSIPKPKAEETGGKTIEVKPKGEAES